jgi:hypothetical protein
MNEICTRVLVGPDLAFPARHRPRYPRASTRLPSRCRVARTGNRPLCPSTQATCRGHDLGPWLDGLSLRREDIYEDYGR